MKNIIGLSILVLFFLILSCGKDDSESKMQSYDELRYSSEPQLNVLNAGIEENPDDPLLYYKRAKYFFFQQNFKNAQDDIQKAIRLKDTHHEYWLLSAQIHYELKDIDNALNDGLKALQLGNTEPAEYVLLANAYLDKNDKVSAEKYLTKLLDIAPHMADVSYIEGRRLLKNGDTLASMSRFKDCVKKDPQNIDSYIQLMSIYYNHEQYDSIMPLLIKAKRMRPCSPELYLYEGKFYESIKRIEVAFAAYKEGLSCNPQAMELYLPLGALYEKQLNYKEAMNYMTRWLEKNPSDSKIILKMGDLAVKQNDPSGAITYYKNYLSLDTANVKIQKEIQRLQKQVNTATDSTRHY